MRSFLGGVTVEAKKEHISQDIRLSMREKLEVSGVVDVIRFDDICVVLETRCGELTVDGKNIKISVLDTDKGLVSLEGLIDAMYYSSDNKKEKRDFFGKLFS